MEVEIKDQKYFLSWKYIVAEDTKYGKRDMTILEVKQQGKIVDKIPVIRNPHESFVKEHARKATIKKMMSLWNLDKTTRTHIWKQYFSR